MDDRITVRLIGPAKIGRDWRRTGDTPSVTLDEARQLKEAGLLAGDDIVAVADLAPGMPGFDEAVAAMAKVLAEAAVAAAVEASTAELIAERDAVFDQLEQAHAGLSEQAGRIAELEDQIANASPPSGGSTAVSEVASSSEDPAAPQAAKPAKKSGAAKKD